MLLSLCPPAHSEGFIWMCVCALVCVEHCKLSTVTFGREEDEVGRTGRTGR